MGQSVQRVALGLWVFLLVLFMLAVGLVLPAAFRSSTSFIVAWLLIAGALLAVIILSGYALGKGGAGILIDPASNMISLSRFQVTLWTWLLLSTFMTVALGRIALVYQQTDRATQQCTVNGIACTEPLAIELPPLLWALMGISLTSATGSPLLKTVKTQRTQDQDRQKQNRARREPSAEPPPTFAKVLARRAEKEPDNPAFKNATAVGALVRKATPAEARFADLFSGEEVSNFQYLDLAKLQNFFFTLVAAVAYGAALLIALSQASTITAGFSFPDLPEGLVALIGISHAGYLTDKAITHSVPENAPQRSAPPPPAP